MKVINPATEIVIREIPDDNVDSLHKKLTLLRNELPAWSAAPLEERIRIVRRFSELIAQQASTLATVLTDEVGKPLAQSHNELKGARARIQWLADHASKYLSDEVMTVASGLEERIRYEPLGVVCNISAWNYPWLVGVNVFVPALLAGNTVMYKPSEHATLTGLEIERLLKEAGVPPGAFQLAAGGSDTGEALLDMPFDGYFFTGSYKTGRYLYERVAHKMVPCQCELGGKDPLYVADDVSDVAAVAAATADGAFYNNGQSCCAVERLYVHESIFDAYVDAFTGAVTSWKIGHPANDGVYFGPLTRKDQLSVLEEQIRDAVSRGARILTGGKRMEGTGYFFEPTILTDVNHSMKVMREESFGPIIGIMKVKDDEEAIAMMNDTEYGLTAAVYSADGARAERILSRIDSGTGYWNCCDRVSAAVPWSGRKHSGFGATLSHAGLRAFAKPKAYHLRQP